MKRDAIAVAVLLAAVAVGLAPVVFGGRVPIPDYLRWFAPWADGELTRTAWNPLWYDAVGQYWPWRTLLHDGLRDGLLPYWNPYQLSGYAFCGNGQSALFYPLNWLFFGLFPVATGFRLTAVCHLALASCGTYWLLRELGGRRAAAVAGGLVFGLSGFLVTWLMLPTLISSAAWLPVAVAGVERAGRRGSVAWAAAGGAAVGLSALAGHPQVFYYVAATAGLVALIRLGRRPAALGLFLVVAGLLAAPSVLPLMELAPRSHRPPARSAEGYGAFLDRAIPSHRAVTLFSPKLYGTPAAETVPPERLTPGWRPAPGDQRYWGLDRRGVVSPGDYTEFNLFVGLTTLLLLLHALTLRGAARGYAALALAALLLAFGAFPNRWLYFWLPGYSAGAGPCRLALVWSFGAAVAAGLAVDDLSRRTSLSNRAPWLLAALAIGSWSAAVAAMAPYGLTGAVLAGAVRPLGLPGFVVVVGLATWLAGHRPVALAGLIAVELLAFGRGFNPTCASELLDPRPPAVAAAEPADGTRLLVADRPKAWGFYHPPRGLLWPPNLATAAGLRDAGGYDSLLPAEAKEALSVAAERRPTSPAINGNMLLLGEADPDRTGAAVSVLMSRRPRPGWRPVAEAPEWVRRRLPAPASRCLLWSPVTGTEPLPAEGLVVDGCNRVTLVVTRGSPLLLDSAYPGWRCRVGPAGSTALAPAGWLPSPFPAPYHRGRFVPLAADTLSTPYPVRVQWVFAPATLRVGLFAALLGLALLAAVAMGRQSTDDLG